MLISDISLVPNMSWCRFIIFTVVLVFTSKCSASVNILSAVSEISTKPIQNIVTNSSDFIDVAAENGYKAEKHEVTTEDGYILTMHRIPPRTNCVKKTPMLVVHGLLQASEAFLDAGSEAPGCVFAKDCYDVWFGNVRGNYHSRRHIHLDPDKDLEFWKFSIDQIGLYDIPAMIDYVLNTTSSKKLIYLGYSQGGGTFLIMNSERPEYASKVSLFVALSPGSRQLNTKSVAYRTATKSVNAFQAPLEAAGVWEILSEGFPVQGVLSSLCQVELLAAVICGFASSALDSPHPDSMTPDIQKRLYRHFPAGTSVQSFAQYGQSMDDENFSKFNYGPEINEKVYGSTDPPKYNLKATKIPTVIYHGGPADLLVDERDVDWAVSQLPNVLEYIKIKDPLWNHLDMAYSRYWKETIYVTMKKYLSQYDLIY